MSDKSFGFIGVGNMSGAIIGGILNKGYIKPSNIYMYDKDDKKYGLWSKCGVQSLKSVPELVDKCDFIFLCVKPQNSPEILPLVAEKINGGKCVVSIMAGIAIDTISGALSGHKNIVRVMPNTPLLVGKGAAALVRSSGVTDEDFDTVSKIFSLAGEVVVVSEDKISAVTAISGSGPAYFFKFANAAVEEAQALGLDEDIALHLLAQTMAGSAKMLLESGKTPNELVRMVTSPGGTTKAANDVFDECGYEDIIKKAIKACNDRAIELGAN